MAMKVVSEAPGKGAADTPEKPGPAESKPDTAEKPAPENKEGAKPSGQEAVDIPDKLRGKSPEEIVRMFVETDSERGRLATELGKKNETIEGLQKLGNMQRAQQAPQEPEASFDQKMADLYEEYDKGDMSDRDLDFRKSQLIREDTRKSVRAEIRQEILDEQEEASRRKFASENKDLMEMYNDGNSPMRQLMRSDPAFANNPLAAYLYVKNQQSAAEKEAALAASKKEGYDAALEEFKKNAGGSGAAEGVLASGSDQSLRSPDQTPDFDKMTNEERVAAMAARAGLK